MGNIQFMRIITQNKLGELSGYSKFLGNNKIYTKV